MPVIRDACPADLAALPDHDDLALVEHVVEQAHRLVGIGHLVGDDALPAMLATDGIDVARR